MQLVEPAFAPASGELNADQHRRDEVLKYLEATGQRPIAYLSEMSDAERCKWLFWNLHENL